MKTGFINYGQQTVSPYGNLVHKLRATNSMQQLEQLDGIFNCHSKFEKKKKQNRASCDEIIRSFQKTMLGQRVRYLL